jgi:hypothetical protein
MSGALGSAGQRSYEANYIRFGTCAWAFAAAQLAATTLRGQIVVTFVFGGL